MNIPVLRQASTPHSVPIWNVCSLMPPKALTLPPRATCARSNAPRRSASARRPWRSKPPNRPQSDPGDSRAAANPGHSGSTAYASHPRSAAYRGHSRRTSWQAWPRAQCAAGAQRVGCAADPGRLRPAAYASHPRAAAHRRHAGLPAHRSHAARQARETLPQRQAPQEKLRHPQGGGLVLARARRRERRGNAERTRKPSTPHGRTTRDYVWNTVGVAVCGAWCSPCLTIVVTQLAGAEQAGMFSLAFVTGARCSCSWANYGVRNVPGVRP